MPVVELHPKERVGQRFDHRALDLDGTVFLGHVFRASLVSAIPLVIARCGDRPALLGSPLVLPCRYGRSWSSVVVVITVCQPCHPPSWDATSSGRIAAERERSWMASPVTQSAAQPLPD